MFESIKLIIFNIPVLSVKLVCAYDINIFIIIYIYLNTQKDKKKNDIFALRYL